MDSLQEGETGSEGGLGVFIGSLLEMVLKLGASGVMAYYLVLAATHVKRFVPR